MTVQCCGCGCRTGQPWMGVTPPPCCQTSTTGVVIPVRHATGSPAPDPVQELQQSGMTVEDHPELLRVLRKHPDLVPLLRGASVLLIHRLPLATLHLQWYRDPEDPQDAYLLLLVRLPSYEEEAQIRSLVSAVEEANLILSAGSIWVLVTTDFQASTVTVSRRILDAIQDAVMELLATQLELLRGEITEAQGWQWLIDFFLGASAEVRVAAREQGVVV